MAQGFSEEVACLYLIGMNGLNLFVLVLDICQLSSLMTSEMEFHYLRCEYEKKHCYVWNCPISFTWCSAPTCEENTVSFHLPFSCHPQSCRALSNSPSDDSTPGWRVSNFLHHMEAAPETWSPLSLFTYSLWNGSMRITHSTEEAE